jgi:4-hydroxy-tetrahydrodipicolinate synthase
MPDHPFRGVLPAITTPFLKDLAIDHAALARHCRFLLEHGCDGLVALGSLGEGATLEPEEKRAVLATCVAVAGEAPVVAGVAALSTAQAVRLAQVAAETGCRGLMVLPPYAHKGPPAEIETHFGAVFEATGRPCMLYNNPIAYGSDMGPEAIARLAERHRNLVAVKESSGDVRRVTAVRALLGDRLAVLAGLDDMILEALGVGADGWVAGLANALPRESVELVRWAREGRRDAAWELYRWFLPLLRLDTVPEFVQLIKLVQQEVGVGSETVRPPRLPLAGSAREEALAVIRGALARRPAVTGAGS